MAVDAAIKMIVHMDTLVRVGKALTVADGPTHSRAAFDGLSVT
jgi:hypothetical protein